MRRPAVLAALLLFALPAAAAEVPPVHLVAHEALYRLTLANGRDQVVGATGTMGYEVTDACRTWDVRQRLDLTVTNTDGNTSHTVSDYDTQEAKDGLSLRFRMVQSSDGAVSSETDGEARLDGPGGAGVADYAKPEVARVALPKGTLFPMAHTAALIRATEEGRKFFTIPVFDGTDDAGAELSSIVPLQRLGPGPDRWPALAALPSVVVHIAFFPTDPAQMLPDYEVGMRYWTNGVADDLRMDFGDFVMDGTLIGFRPLPSRC